MAQSYFELVFESIYSNNSHLFMKLIYVITQTLTEWNEKDWDVHTLENISFSFNPFSSNYTYEMQMFFLR